MDTAGQCLLVIHYVNSFEGGRQWLWDKKQNSPVCFSVIFFLALIDYQFQIRQLWWIPEAVWSLLFSTADPMRVGQTTASLWLMRTITLTKQQQQQAKGWLEAQFLMSIQDNMCCRCHATVDKETHNFNSHADHKQDPLMRDRASSTKILSGSAQKHNCTQHSR